MKEDTADSKDPGSTASRSGGAIPADTTILIDARIRAGQQALQLKSIASLCLHDPVVTLDFLQAANSSMFAGASIIDVESALSRLGVERLINMLGDLRSVPHNLSEEASEVLDILRYNCRRVSIVSMIVAAAVRPSLTGPARVAGLFADVGHMLAFMKLGDVYTQLAKSTGRKNLAYRLEKDHRLDLGTILVKYLRSKGLPRALLLAYDNDEEVKGANDADLRLCLRSALELVDAYDANRFHLYAPGKTLPTQSFLRLLKPTAAQQQRIHKAVSEYLKIVSQTEAPEGAGVLIGSIEEDDSKVIGGEQGSGEEIRIPMYTNTAVKPKSRLKLEELYVLCEGEKSPEILEHKAMDLLVDIGLFTRAATLELDPNGERVTIRSCVGLGRKPGEIIPITSAASPFMAFRVEIRSANLPIDAVNAPFGASAFAMGPIFNLPSGAKILLYVDFSGAKILSMESRRVFRLSLGLLMRGMRGQ